MPKFKNGDKIKKVRGFYNIGLTGTVVNNDRSWHPEDTHTILVKADSAWLVLSTTYPPTVIGAGEAGGISWANPDEWERCNPGDQTLDEIFAEELDEEDELVIA